MEKSMSFPPEFSSTTTYANRYDLDEIDVFVEGNSNNPMFFSIGGLSRVFTFGKHYFTISMLTTENELYQLNSGSRVLFEFKSINNVVLRSDVVEINQRNGLITCFFEILRDPLRTYKEVQDGQGTFIIAASLQNKQTTPADKRIPEKFINAINYRCVYPISIGKNSIGGDSLFITNTTHTTSTLTGQFSFSNNSIPSTGNDPNNGAEYDPSSGVKTTIQKNFDRDTL
tara:strand:- start:1471 stop:2154 length:684 start_codon:yes stop_codon:yes gene_type:complete